MFATVNERLNKHIAKHLQRKRQVVQGRQGILLRCEGQFYIDFCSNDYLGLSQHPQVIAALTQGATAFGVGSSASQLVSGHFLAHRQLEQAFAQFLNRDKALLFASGYHANIGVIQALLGRRDQVVLIDKLCHASLVDGLAQTKAKVLRYRHLDVAHLQARIAQVGDGDKLIVSESVFSMDGDLADLPALARVANTQGAMLMLDDAHGIGVLGKQGAGALEHFGLTQQEVPILVCPLGKAFAGMGAIVAGSEALIENLIQFSRSYMYSTALPPALASASLASLSVIQNESWRREKLAEHINYFKQQAHLRGLLIGESDTPIQLVQIGAADKTMAVSAYLLEKGYWVGAFRPPTVPQNSARLRITLSCLHSKKHINDLLNEVLKAHETIC